jgi:hypothetical protein
MLCGEIRSLLVGDKTLCREGVASLRMLCVLQESHASRLLRDRARAPRHYTRLSAQDADEADAILQKVVSIFILSTVLEV